jgi:hypothetical protein
VNGYVLLPDNHPFYGKDYDEIDVDAHGGITYADEDGWIGFDTAHAFDYWAPAELAKFGGKPSKYSVTYEERMHMWTLDLLEKETKRLARQIDEKDNN